MKDQWFVLARNQEHGPFKIRQLRQMAQSGKLKTHHRLKNPDLQGPVSASKVGGIFLSVPENRPRSTSAPSEINPRLKENATSSSFNRVGWTPKRLIIAGVATGASASMLFLTVAWLLFGTESKRFDPLESETELPASSAINNAAADQHRGTSPNVASDDDEVPPNETSPIARPTFADYIPAGEYEEIRWDIQPSDQTNRLIKKFDQNSDQDFLQSLGDPSQLDIFSLPYNSKMGITEAELSSLKDGLKNAKLRPTNRKFKFTVSHSQNSITIKESTNPTSVSLLKNFEFNMDSLTARVRGIDIGKAGWMNFDDDFYGRAHGYQWRRKSFSSADSLPGWGRFDLMVVQIIRLAESGEVLFRFQAMASRPPETVGDVLVSQGVIVKHNRMKSPFNERLWHLYKRDSSNH